MTTITTLDDLNRVATGAVIALSDGTNSTFTRTTEGWLGRDGAILLSGDFVGQMNAGRVALGITRDVGQVYRDRHGYYRIIQAAIESTAGHRWYSLHYEDGSFDSMQDLPDDAIIGDFVPESNHPSWVRNATAFGRVLASAKNEMRRMARARDEANTARNEAQRAATTPVNVTQERSLAVGEFRVAVERRLHSFFETHWSDWDSSMVDDFNDVLDESGMDRVSTTESVTVEIEVTGTFSTYMDDVLAETVGGGVNVDTERVHIPWSRTFNVTRDVDPQDCGDHGIDNDDVRQLLEDAGVSFDDFDINSSDCPHC